MDALEYTKHDDVIKGKRIPRYWPFVRGIHRPPVNSPHKGQGRGALMVSMICGRINGWVNNREAGDLRRYRAHYDVIVMIWETNLELSSSFHLLFLNPACGKVGIVKMNMIQTFIFPGYSKLFVERLLQGRGKRRAGHGLTLYVIWLRTPSLWHSTLSLQ